MRAETFFLKPSVDLAKIKEAIEGTSIGLCDSVEVPGNEAAQAFLQHQQYSEGCPQSITICWHEAATPHPVSVDTLAQNLANALGVSVLYEACDSVSDSAEEKWCLAVAGQRPCVVQINEMNDGISVRRMA